MDSGLCAGVGSTAGNGTPVALAAPPAPQSLPGGFTAATVYYVVNASSTDWRHDTTFEVPANTLVHFTIYQYDTATGLRNPYFSQTAGTVGSVLFDGKPAAVVMLKRGPPQARSF